MPIPDSPVVYQLRIRLDGISPLIWRRLLVTGETSIANLHTIIQIALGWTDSHLHQFVIHGKSYGITYPGGMSFADNPDQVHLAHFRFRTRDRFFYEYNFHVPWQHEIRVEQIVSPAPDQRYPIWVYGNDSRQTGPFIISHHRCPAVAVRPHSGPLMNASASSTACSHSSARPSAQHVPSVAGSSRSRRMAMLRWCRIRCSGSNPVIPS
jgi:Plasmid pRiA4b ORF-3-like protein